MAWNVDSVGGQMLGKERGRVMAFAAGRVCEEKGCHTRLSIYNSRSRCAAHDFDVGLMNFRSPSPAPTRQPGRAPRLSRPQRVRRRPAA
jgi:hypothetical protein